MPNEETKVCTFRLPVALLADLKECAADQHRSVNSILWSAAEDYIRAWRAAQSQEHAEFIASLTTKAATPEAAPDVTAEKATASSSGQRETAAASKPLTIADALADEETQPEKARRQGQG